MHFIMNYSRAVCVESHDLPQDRETFHFYEKDSLRKEERLLEPSEHEFLGAY